jgi:outer membrane protein assembly factor BamE (lipoprotein component of BamABCDE complex)
MVDRVLSFLRWGVFPVICMIGGLFLIAYWFGEGHGASLSRLKQVRPGMSRKEVLKLLGNPGTINRAEDGSQSWFYTRGTFCQVKVYMDRDGIVEDTDHDH